jgi:hypothetical protein
MSIWLFKLLKKNKIVLVPSQKLANAGFDPARSELSETFKMGDYVRIQKEKHSSRKDMMINSAGKSTL